MLNQETPSLGAVIAEAIEARLIDVHTGIPARVLSYDAVKQKCSVQIELRQATFDESGARIPLPLPIINNVPVVFGSGGGYRTTYPLAAGDPVWLDFAECSLDRWKPRGGDTDPFHDRRFNLSDAVAHPGCADFGHALANAPTDRMSIGHDAGATVDITQAAVFVGGSTGAQPTFQSTHFLTAFNTLMGTVGSAVGTSGSPAGAAAAAVTIAAAMLTFATDVAAAITTITQVK